jgi:phosphinothricin acetyltransferase
MLDQPPQILVRPSTEQDVPFMVDIYAHHVQHGLGDYTPEPLHPEDIKRRRKAMLKRRLPHIVADRAGEIVGYAYAVPFLKRPAYRYAVKHSIYVRHDHLHSGIGKLLLPTLIEACAVAGFRQMICYIDSANAPSLRLHEAAGFERAGVLKSVGLKFGHWADTVLLQRPLGDGNTSLPDAQECSGDAAPLPRPAQ